MRRTLILAALLCACSSSSETSVGETAVPSADASPDTSVPVATGGAPGAGGSPSVGGSPSLGGSPNVGGAPSTGGAAGAGGVPEAAPPAPGKVDLLFVIDNSSSTADKQALLAGIVPELVGRMVDPICVDDATGGEVASTSGAACPSGSRRQFPLIESIHVGVLSSSIGGHGTTNCPDPDSSLPDAHNNDHAHLITRGAPVGTADAGFLDYAAGQPSPRDATAVKNAFVSMILGVGQHGCGYEAQLEAPYRFLVDPEPPETVVLVTDPGSGQTVIQTTGPDPVILAERAAFLRPDSVVLVVLVTDEDDCSLMDEGQAYLAISPATGVGATRYTMLTHGTSVCRTDPNNPCCHNCMVSPPLGCPPTAGDPECQAGYYLSVQDPDNLRCWSQKQRYGIDFLYPVKRYIDGFSKAQIENRAHAIVQNPLTLGRAGGSVLFAAIVGVPWQDVARDPTDLTKGLKPAQDLAWDTILGDPAASPLVLPGDPLMIPSVLARTATTTTSPLGAAALPMPPGSPVGANPVNGHEWDTSQANPPNSDLQYACVFDLPVPRDCTVPGSVRDCDCVNGSTGTVQTMMSPLCQGPSGYTNMQVRAKGYPGLRELAVVKGLGAQGIVGSICPANLTDSTRADWGYRPAIRAMLERVSSSLTPH